MAKLWAKEYLELIRKVSFKQLITDFDSLLNLKLKALVLLRLNSSAGLSLCKIHISFIRLKVLATNNLII